MLLDLGGRRCRLAALGCLDEVGVLIGKFECGRALLGDVGDIAEGRAHADQQPDHAAS
jgi:hypothetical protein